MNWETRPLTIEQRILACSQMDEWEEQMPRLFIILFESFEVQKEINLRMAELINELYDRLYRAGICPDQ